MVDYRRIAEQIGIEEATLRAVIDVESAGSGFLADGRPKILFEAHIFYRELKEAGLNYEKVARQMPSICSPIWNRSLYLGGAKEYTRLDKAMTVSEECALKSASWGMFQIMGFNHIACKIATVQEFVEQMKTYEGQIQAFVNFIDYNQLTKHLVAKDWAKFARGYNGSGYAQNEYDIKLADSYAKYKNY